jgi:Glycerol dehydrogenase and related enzymes
MNNVLIPGYSIGADAYDSLPKICATYGKTAVLIGGKQACAAAQDKILAAVSKSTIEILETLWYGGECSEENIEMLTPKARKADMVFAVGGGKAIDTAKVLAQRMDKPFFTFPTLASTCAACTSLGIVYHPDGSLREYSFSKVPPNHIFIDTDIIAHAPVKYLWAGIGDTMAKHYECTISSRGDTPSHSDAMGIALSTMCTKPIQRWGKDAMEACAAHQVTREFTETVLGIIVSTGLVSNFVQVDYTSGLAHAVYNGFTVIPAIEQNHHLHGEIVSYGILVLLTADRQLEERERVFQFNKSIGLPTKLADIHATEQDLPKMAQKALMGIDVRKYPYKVTEDVIIRAILELEEYNTTHA